MSTAIQTRVEFQKLAAMRLAEAKVLLVEGHWSGAYYLAGYAVECALKACIAKWMQAEVFPDKEFAIKCYTHSIEQLIVLAKLGPLFDAATAADSAFSDNRGVVKDWSEKKRYHIINEAEARELISAIEDGAHGVLSWLKSHW